jgi:protein-tyrosine phosphatase
MARERFVVESVCHGNICRSPMVAAVLRSKLDDAALLGLVTVASSGVSAEEQGNPIDARAARALGRRGYPVDGRHRAHRITDQEIRRADLILPATAGQLRALERRGAAPGSLRLIRSFEPGLVGAPDLDDPWYGGPEDFETVLDQIEAAAPGVVEYVRGIG